MTQLTLETAPNSIAALLEWPVPVRIQVGYGLPELVYGPAQAVDVLENRWPTRDGKHYRDALGHCRSAADRLVPLAKAREVFVAASIEANMLAR